MIKSKKSNKGKKLCKECKKYDCVCVAEEVSISKEMIEDHVDVIEETAIEEPVITTTADVKIEYVQEKKLVLKEQFVPSKDALGIASLKALGYEITPPNETMGCTITNDWAKRAFTTEVELHQSVYMTRMAEE